MIATTRHHAAALIAVLALLGQAVFPHVHAWHGPRASAAPETELARCAPTCPMIATMSEQDGNGHTHDAPCPLCRAQNDARSLLLALASSPALPLDVASALAADSIAAVLSAVRRATAPRAPPILA